MDIVLQDTPNVQRQKTDVNSLADDQPIKSPHTTVQSQLSNKTPSSNDHPTRSLKSSTNETAGSRSRTSSVTKNRSQTADPVTSPVSKNRTPRTSATPGGAVTDMSRPYSITTHQSVDFEKFEKSDTNISEEFDDNNSAVSLSSVQPKISRTPTTTHSQPPIHVTLQHHKHTQTEEHRVNCYCEI